MSDSDLHNKITGEKKCKKCKSCNVIESFANNNIWIHMGQGKMDTNKMAFYKFDPMTCKESVTLNTLDTLRFSNMNPAKLNPTQVFNDIDLPKYNSRKPFDCVWFSHGSWFVDSYNESNGRCEYHRDCEEEIMKGFAIQNPKNILHVNTKEQLEKFIDEYEGKDEKFTDVFSSVINWNKIKENGYYGVSFGFKHVSEIGYNNFPMKSRYSWHSGFDVESLCIWDLRAFDNLYPIVI